MYVLTYWGFKLCYWWNHSNEGCLNKSFVDPVGSQAVDFESKLLF